MLLIMVIRGKVKNEKTRIIKILSIINICCLALEVCGMFLGANYEKYPTLNIFVLKAMLPIYVAWMGYFGLFVYSISNDNKKKAEKFEKIMLIVVAIVSIATILLPIYYNTKNGVIMYTTGPSVQLVYIYSLICEMTFLLMMFANIKRIKASKYVSLFILISLGTLTFAIQSAYPEVILSSSIQTFVSYIVYYTIQNNEKKAVGDK